MNPNLVAAVSAAPAAARPACLGSYEDFLWSFVPSSRAMRVHLVVAGQEPVGDTGTRYGCDFAFRANEQAYIPMHVRWVDDASYAAYQAGDHYGNEYDLPADGCAFGESLHLTMVAHFGCCESSVVDNIPF